MSEFVEVKTAELVGPALDWAVAKVVGHPADWEKSSGCLWFELGDHEWIIYSPSTNWAQGGPLWDEWATFMEHYDGWLVAVVGGDAQGHTKLIALCRAIVSAKLGDVVQVPNELIGGAQ